MPPKAAKRKLKAPTGSDNDLFVSPDENPRKKTRASASRAARGGEYDEDEGRQGSKQFMDWAQWQKKFNDKEKQDIRNYISTFQDKVVSGREEVSKMLDRSKNGLDDVGVKTLDVIKQAYDSAKAIAPGPKQNGKARASGWKSRAEHPLFTAGQQIFSACEDIVAVYERANVQSRGAKLDLPRGKWEQDERGIQELLRFGCQYGEMVAEYIILPDMDKKMLTPDRKTLGETGNMAVDMFKKSSEGCLTTATWGETARAQARALTDALNGLPAA